MISQEERQLYVQAAQELEDSHEAFLRCVEDDDQCVEDDQPRPTEKCKLAERRWFNAHRMVRHLEALGFDSEKVAP